MIDSKVSWTILIWSEDAFVIWKLLLTNFLFAPLPTKIYVTPNTINEIHATLKSIINKVRTIKEEMINPVISWFTSLKTKIVFCTSWETALIIKLLLRLKW